MLYVQGHPPDTRAHRKKCSLYHAVLEAEPREDLRPFSGQFFEVSAEVSAAPPRWAKLYVQHCGRLFCREITMDSLGSPWDPEWGGHHPLLAFIAVSDDCRMQGVAVIRNPTGDHPVLAWTWIVPSMRNQGVFTRIWNMLSKRFPNFYVEGPYSAEMESYLQHRNVPVAQRCGGQYITEPGPVRFFADRIERRRP